MPDEVRRRELEQKRRWRERDPEAWRRTHRSSQEAWNAANREKRAQMVREGWERWKARNPERALAIRREVCRRRQRATGASRVDYSAVLERDGMVCHLCGDPIPSLDDLHFDHVIPLAKGGEHTLVNVRPSHALCNLRKGARIP